MLRSELYFLASGVIDGGLVSDSLQSRLIDLRSRISSTAKEQGRNSAEIILIGVSKTRTAEEIVAAYQLGLSDFGENRVQEAFVKCAEVNLLIGIESGIRKICWHLIGHLQSNKVNRAVELFEVIHSIDTVDLARRVGEAAGSIGKVVNCYVQVNASEEATKSGTSFAEAEYVASSIVAQNSLRLLGFMTIGPLTDDVTAVEDSFKRLQDLRDSIEKIHPDWGKLGLSMGMSNDFELAIACGSTTVRVGSALFGERDYSQGFGSA